MRRDFQAVASAQNSPFLAWQALLLASSWRKSFDGTLVVMAHADPGADLLDEFALLGKAGARLERRPDFSTIGPVPCFTRNHPGSLLTAPGEAALTVLLDTDLLFSAPVDWPACPAAPGVVVTTTDSYEGYTNAASDGCPGWVEEGCRRLGVDFASLAAHGPWGGVPYVVHERDRVRLAREWMACLDALVDVDSSLDGPVPWTGDMWAFAFAALRLGLEVRHEGSMRQNPWSNPAQAWFRERATIVHYAHGGPTFDKRWYQDPARARALWDLRPTGDGTCTDLVLAEIEDAGRLYGLADPARRETSLAGASPGAVEQGRGLDVRTRAGEVSPENAGLPRYGAPVGADEHAAVSAAEVARWFNQERVGQACGREAHVSHLGQPEPRLRRALRARGRQRGR